MNLLLDTHVFLWWIDNRAVRADARGAIEAADRVYISLVSAWEVSIKVAVGKLRPVRAFESTIAESGFEKLPITFVHAEQVASLPTHHGDPFDRMLIVQAIAENLTVVTHDRRFEAYGIPLLWA